MANLSGTERRALADALKHQQLADAIADTIDNVEDLTTTELGYLDGITPGTAAANKAVILGASNQIDAMTVTTLTAPTANATNIDAGASGTAGTIDVFPAGSSKGKTQFTATNNVGNTTTTINTAAQAGARTYNVPDAGTSPASFVMTEGTQTINAQWTMGMALRTSNGVGAVVSPSSVTEYGDGTLHKTQITVGGTVNIADPTGAAGYGFTKIYDFPEGAIAVLGCVVSLNVSAGAGGIADDFDGDFSVGTVGTTDSDVGDAGEATIIASTAMPQASGGTTTAKAVSASAVVLDGTTTAADLILNFLIDDADITALDTLSLSGSVTITWINLGDV